MLIRLDMVATSLIPMYSLSDRRLEVFMCCDVATIPIIPYKFSNKYIAYGLITKSTAIFWDLFGDVVEVSSQNNKNDGVHSSASTTPKEAAYEDKFMQQPPKSKSPYGDKDPNVYCVN
jgi:hypothetical protein